MLGTTPSPKRPPSIALRLDRLEAEARTRGWSTDKEVALGLGTSPSNYCRLTDDDLKVRQAPGVRFIATVLEAFPERDFYYFFEVTRTPDSEADGSAEDPATERRAS